MTKKHPVALVTGGGRGIGRAISAALAAEGYSVAINYCHSETDAVALAAELRQSYGTDTMAVGCDVSSEEQVNAMLHAVGEQLGEVDLLINNAGIAQQKLFTDITAEDWDRLFAVDVRGVFLCCRGVLPHMIHQKQGSIINISSMWGLVGASCEVHYSAAKAAVIGLTKALAKEVGPSGIRVNCIAPGVIDTEMNRLLDPETLDALREETPLGIIGEGRDIAEAVLFLASEGARFITGQVLSPNGGIVI
ncbi:MAG: 3-oxoacyl-ACP reductase FabG [Angelakisella sp.]